jgi:O-acetyl-ADP-ribose deacetylase (regulator of RNase III)
VIEVGAGSILDAQVEAIVNPANCVGAMGAGLALEIRRKWPTVYDSLYQATCDGIVHIGSVHWSATGVAQPCWVIHLPTKLHWRNPSKLEWVEAGMQDLVAQVRLEDVKSVAIPALGCRLPARHSAVPGR